MRFVCLAILFFLASKLSAQIINIEDIRQKVDSSGWYGNADLTFYYNQNTKKILSLRPALNVLNRRGDHAFLAIANYNLVTEIDAPENGSAFERDGYIHFRYNYFQNKWLVYEVLCQYMNNKPLYIADRILTGGGVRLRFLNEDQHQLFLGLTALYEYDSELDTTITHSNGRASTYLSYRFETEKVMWSSAIYYQPYMGFAPDYRFFGQTRLDIKVWKNFSLLLLGRYTFDSFPAAGRDLPRETFNLSTGLSYSF
ncbi:MAG: DUF481 domain-containing protein [Bacteroidota bacterium]|nr:DUF481 domain-containing protein [Bacteroidota bacterium]